MVAGLPYFANVDELLNGRLFAKCMCLKLNTLNPIEPKEPILKELFGTFSFNCYVEPPFYCDYGSNIHLGKGVYMNHNCLILDVCEVTIGQGLILTKKKKCSCHILKLYYIFFEKDIFCTRSSNIDCNTSNRSYSAT